MFAFHQCLLLHLVNLYLFQWNIDSLSFQFPSQKLVFFFELVYDSPLEYLVGLFVLGLEVEVVHLEDHLRLVVGDLLIEILHFLVSWHLHALEGIVLVIIELLFQRFVTTFLRLYPALQLTNLVLSGFCHCLCLNQTLFLLTQNWQLWVLL
jgi:hypothetical protein